LQVESGASLVCRVGDLLCALPLVHVGETMRPLPIEPLAGVPAFVSGLAVVRDRPTPVIDASALLCDQPSVPQRFVTVRPGPHAFILAVDAVVGVRTLPPDVAGELPALMRTARLAAVASAGALDGELLLLLESARLVPDEAWLAIERRSSPA
jgi:purine-binding chemotaxis protein CheW